MRISISSFLAVVGCLSTLEPLHGFVVPSSVTTKSICMTRKPTSTTLFYAELPDISNMKAADMRKELESHGVSTRSLFEKVEFEEALRKVRAMGRGGRPRSSSPSGSSSSRTGSSSSSAGSAYSPYGNPSDNAKAPSPNSCWGREAAAKAGREAAAKAEAAAHAKREEHRRGSPSPSDPFGRYGRTSASSGGGGAYGGYGHQQQPYQQQQPRRPADPFAGDPYGRVPEEPAAYRQQQQQQRQRSDPFPSGYGARPHQEAAAGFGYGRQTATAPPPPPPQGHYASSTSTDTTSTKPPPSQQDLYQKAFIEAQAMKVGELREALHAMGVSTLSFFEKSEFVRSYAKVMSTRQSQKQQAQQAQKQQYQQRTTTTGSAHYGSGPHTSGDGFYSDEPYDPDYRDVEMHKVEPERWWLRAVIDVKVLAP